MFSISQEIFQAMVEHTRTSLPNEACGILARHRGKAVKIYPASNRDASPIHYQLEPSEQFQTFQEIEEKRWELGIYHSHVKAKAYPSREDIESAYYPEALYLILSLRDGNHPVLRGFWIRDGVVKEEKIQKRRSNWKGKGGGLRGRARWVCRAIQRREARRGLFFGGRERYCVVDYSSSSRCKARSS